MASVQPFVFPTTGQPVRAVDVDGEPWFIAADVCAALDITNVGNALARLDDDEKRSIRLTDGTPGNPNRGIVNEAGLYALILRSDKPEARAFKRWITHDVLPTLRRTGRYEIAPQQLDRRALAEMVIAEADRADAAEARVAELAPVADAWHALADATGDYSVREAAQLLSRDPAITIGQNRLFAYLRDLRWVDGSGQPYQAQVDNGRLVRRTTSYTHPHTGEPVLTAQVRITPKGIEELRKRLLDGQQTQIGGAA